MTDPDHITPDAILVGYYKAAADRLHEILLHPPGKTESSQAFRQARAASLIRQIQELTAKLGEKAIKRFSKELQSAFHIGIQNGLIQARQAGVYPPSSAIQGSFDLIDPHTLEVLARDTYAALAQKGAADLTKAAISMGQTGERLLRKTAQLNLGESEINRILAGGVIEGTPAETIRTLRDEFRRVNDGGLVEVIDKNGNPMHFDAGYYAEMVVRTRTREATCLARHTKLQELGLDLVRIVGRISNNFCTAFLGQVFSLSGQHPKYPALDSLPDGGPPFHPNCSKSTAPYIEDMASPEEEKQAAQDAGTEQLLGMTPSEAQKAYKSLQLRSQAERRSEQLAADIRGGAPAPGPQRQPLTAPGEIAGPQVPPSPTQTSQTRRRRS